MEALLHLYGLPYDKQRPLICFDELPVQLLGEVVAPLPVKEGRGLRFDYEYEREGTACLLVAFEPLTGRRIVETSRRAPSSNRSVSFSLTPPWLSNPPNSFPPAVPTDGPPGNLCRPPPSGALEDTHHKSRRSRSGTRR